MVFGIVFHDKLDAVLNVEIYLEATVLTLKRARILIYNDEIGTKKIYIISRSL